MLTLILSSLLYVILICPKILGTMPFMHWPDKAAHVCPSSGHKWMTCEEGGCQETETL